MGTVFDEIARQQQARWTSRVPDPEKLEEQRQYYYNLLNELSKMEAELERSKKVQVWTYRTAIVNAAARVAGAAADVELAAANRTGGAASVITKTMETQSDALGKLSLSEPNAEILDKARKAMGGAALIQSTWQAQGAFAQVEDYLAQAEKAATPNEQFRLRELAYAAFVKGANPSARKGFTQARSDVAALQNRNEVISTAKATADLVGRQVFEATKLVPEGSTRPAWQKMALRYAAEVADPEGAALKGFDIQPDEWAQQGEAAAQAQEILDQTRGHYKELLQTMGLGAAATARAFEYLDNAFNPDFWKTTGERTEEYETPSYISEQRERVEDAIARLEQSQDPYDRAIANYVRQFNRAAGVDELPDADARRGIDPFTALRGAMNFQGEHRYDRAVIWAAKNAPLMKAYVEAVRSDPSLADFRNSNDAIAKTRDWLREHGAKTKASERTFGIRVAPGDEAAREAAASSAATPAPAPTTPAPAATAAKPAEPAPATPTPTPTATPTAKSAPPAEAPVADVKPAEKQADQLYLEADDQGELSWGYRVAADGSIRIFRAPPGHERAVSMKPVSPELQKVIQEHIDDGRAQLYSGEADNEVKPRISPRQEREVEEAAQPFTEALGQMRASGLLDPEPAAIEPAEEPRVLSLDEDGNEIPEPTPEEQDAEAEHVRQEELMRSSTKGGLFRKLGKRSAQEASRR